MRAKISEVYPGKKWHERCAKMSTNQVVAVYRSLEKKNFDRNYGVTKKTAEPEENEPHQMDIFEYMIIREAEEKRKSIESIDKDYEFKENDHKFYGRVNGKFIEFESEAEYMKYLTLV